MSFDTAYRPLVTRDLLFVDLETGGTDPDFHEICELAAVRCTADMKTEISVVERRVKITRPERMDPKAAEVNGYSVEAWRDAVSLRVAVCELNAIADEHVLIVGQNPIFDLNFLRVAFKSEGLKPLDPRYVIDTASMAWPLCHRGIIERISLEVICARFGIPNTGSHRALTDVRRTMHAYARMLGIGNNVPALKPKEEEIPEWAKI